MFWVYMLKCADQSYYTGHTDHLKNRLSQHYLKADSSCFTATRLPVHLVFSQEFATREEALALERQIKGWSRKKKEALIQDDKRVATQLSVMTSCEASYGRHDTNKK